MATFDFASPFLFAGLEADLAAIRRQLLRLAGDLAIRGFLILAAIDFTGIPSLMNSIPNITGPEILTLSGAALCAA